jgi:EAL domain-containing protein (putative c-di-GMP-specific phosphodiesterase class I)
MIVEGIETQEELDTVTELGVRLVQGYLIGRPAKLPPRSANSRSPKAEPAIAPD